MKILFISANRSRNPYPVYPIGLDYIAGVIDAHHIVKIIDMNEIKEYQALEEIIKNFLPDIIGISLRNIDNTDSIDSKSFIGEYQKLTAAIRSYSDSPLVLGGSGFTIFPKEILKELNADYGIIGEGEKFSQLLKALEKKEDISLIQGIITKETDAYIMPEPWHEPFNRKFNKENPHIQYYLKNGGMLNLQTKRGCIYKCIYCTYPHIEGNKLRYIQPEQIAKTALDLQRAGAKYFFITDSVFNSDYQHSIDVAREFIKAGISIPWGAFFTPTDPPENYYKILADAGITHIEFGTESLSDKMLNTYKKPFHVKDVYNAHKSAVDAGLYVAHYFMLGGPNENRDTINETLSHAEELKKTVLFFFCGIRIYPYTPLYDIALNEGQISRSCDTLYPVFYQSKDISNEEIIQCIKNRAHEHSNWIIGSGGNKTARIISRMYKHGHSGPLWEFLIQ